MEDSIMKKTKAVLFISLAIIGVLLLSSCSFFDKDLTYVDLISSESEDFSEVIYTSADPIDELKGMTLSETKGTLALFKKTRTEGLSTFTDYSIYNIAENRIVRTVYASLTEHHNVNFYSLNGYDFFLIRTTNYTLDGISVDLDSKTEHTSLYYSDGREILTVPNYASVIIYGDYIKFDDKYYRFNEEGSMEYAFDVPDLAPSPQGVFIHSNEDYYYTREASGYYNFYDKKLNYVASFTVPSYAMTSGHMVELVLDDGMMLFQYMISADEYSDDYDVVYSKTKVDLVTVLIDPATGKANEIECDYLIVSAIQLGSKYSSDPLCLLVHEAQGKVTNCVFVAPIVGKQVNLHTENYQIATISGDGEFKFIEGVDGVPARPIKRISEDRWLLSTVDSRSMLIDGDGNIIGEVTAANNKNNEYLLANGKIFDHSLNMLYDYEAEGLILKAMFDNFIIFTGEGDEMILFKDGNANILSEKDSNLYCIEEFEECFVLRYSVDFSDTEYRLCNANGEVLLELTDRKHGDFAIDSVLSNGKTLLIQVYSFDEQINEYTYSYYFVH